ncbi:MAG: signal peptidase I [Candidatus Saccharibacteria bacterium]
MKEQLFEIVKETLGILVVAFILAMGLRTFIIDARVVPTGSMLDTIQLKDRLLVDKVTIHFTGLKRGDIIVFKPPEGIMNKEDLVKRLIGLPGDKIEVKDNTVFVNDKPLNEPYLRQLPNYEYGPVTVPPNGLFMMGDNRNESYDSHAWGVWLTKDHVIGRAFAIYWPPSHAHFFTRPTYQ